MSHRSDTENENRIYERAMEVTSLVVLNVGGVIADAFNTVDPSKSNDVWKDVRESIWVNLVDLVQENLDYPVDVFDKHNDLVEQVTDVSIGVSICGEPAPEDSGAIFGLNTAICITLTTGDNIMPFASITSWPGMRMMVLVSSKDRKNYGYADQYHDTFQPTERPEPEEGKIRLGVWIGSITEKGLDFDKIPYESITPVETITDLIMPILNGEVTHVRWDKPEDFNTVVALGSVIGDSYIDLVDKDENGDGTYTIVSNNFTKDCSHVKLDNDGMEGAP